MSYKWRMDKDEFRAALEELGISQRKFANEVNTDVTAVNRWAMGSRKVPGPAAAYLRLVLANHRARETAREGRAEGR
jgi:DNA-binding transcriptional regulator YiaG